MLPVWISNNKLLFIDEMEEKTYNCEELCKNHNKPVEEDITRPDRDVTVKDKKNKYTFQEVCLLCNGSFNNPQLLPCLHTYCMCCLWCGSSTKLMFQCPQCLTSICLPDSGKQLSVNYMFKRLQVQAQIMQQGVVCSFCLYHKKEEKARNICINCKVLLCKTCKKKHKTGSNQEHQSLSLKKIDSESKLRHTLEGIPCNQHPTEMLDFYCNHCLSLHCVECSRLKHCDQYISTVESATVSLKAEFQRLLDAFKAAEQFCKDLSFSGPQKVYKKDSFFGYSGNVTALAEYFVTKSTPSEFLANMCFYQTVINQCMQRCCSKKTIMIKSDSELQKLINDGQIINSNDKKVSMTNNLKVFGYVEAAKTDGKTESKQKANEKKELEQNSIGKKESKQTTEGTQETEWKVNEKKKTGKKADGKNKFKQNSVGKKGSELTEVESEQKADEKKETKQKAEEKKKMEQKANEKKESEQKADRKKETKPKADGKKETKPKADGKKETKQKADEKEKMELKANEKNESEQKVEGEKETKQKAEGKKETKQKADEKKKMEQKANEKKESEQKADGKKETKPKADGKKETKQKADEKEKMELKANEKNESEQKVEGKKETKPKAEEKKKMEQKANEKNESEQKADGKKETKQKADGKKETKQKAEGKKEAKQKADEKEKLEQKADEKKEPEENAKCKKKSKEAINGTKESDQCKNEVHSNGDHRLENSLKASVSVKGKRLIENEKCAKGGHDYSVTKDGQKKETVVHIVKRKKRKRGKNNKNKYSVISKANQSKMHHVSHDQESMEHHIDTVYRIDTKISTDQHIPVVTGVVCIENSWVAVADSKNNNIKLFSTDGIILKEFKAENPSYLTFCAEMLVWSSGHGNQVQLQSVDNEHSYEIHLDNPDILLPHPVAKGKGKKLIIGNGDHICTFTVDNDKCNEGEEVVPRVSKVRPYMTNMMSVSELNKELGHVFTDWQQRAVVFVDKDGLLQGMYTGGTDRIKFLPMGLHIDKPSMTVFVLDHLGNRLLLLDFYGKLICEWKMNVEKPWCISGNDKCEVFIAGNDRFLHVFEYYPF